MKVPLGVLTGVGTASNVLYMNKTTGTRTSFPRDTTADTAAAHQARVSANRKRASRKADQMLACDHTHTTVTLGEVDGIATRVTTCDDCGSFVKVERA